MGKESLAELPAELHRELQGCSYGVLSPARVGSAVPQLPESPVFLKVTSHLDSFKSTQIGSPN